MAKPAISRLVVVRRYKTWRGEEGHGDADVAGDLVTSEDHPGQVEEPHLELRTLNSRLQGYHHTTIYILANELGQVK